MQANIRNKRIQPYASAKIQILMAERHLAGELA